MWARFAGGASGPLVQAVVTGRPRSKAEEPGRASRGFPSIVKREETTMTIGKELPFRRGKRERDTGSLVFDQERKAALEQGGKSAPQSEAQDRHERAE